MSARVYGWLDTAILGFFVSPGLIAAYEVAWRLSKLGLVLSRSVALTTFPQISDWAEDGRTARISQTIRQSFVPSLLIVLPSFVGVLYIGSDVLALLYGPEYVAATAAFVVLSLERTAKSVTQVLSRCLNALDRPDLSARAAIVSILANVIFNVILIPELGILGAALGTSASLVLKFAIEYHYVNDHVGVAPPWREFGMLAAGAALMGVFLHATLSVLTIRSLPVLLVVIVFAGGVYFIALLTMPAMRSHVVTLARAIGPTS